MKKTLSLFTTLISVAILTFSSCHSSSEYEKERQEMLSVIFYQDSLIEEISTHCWENHDCECGWYDDDSYYKHEKILVKYARKYGRQKIQKK